MNMFALRMRWLGLVTVLAVVLTVAAAGSAAHGDTTRVSVTSSPANAQGVNSSVDASMSGNGRLVVFKSNATNLAGTDANGTVADIYLRDRSSGTTSLVSVDPSGNQFATASEEPAISFDGTVVSWESGGQIYVRTLPSGPTELASRTFAGAPGDGVSHEPALSSDGNLVAFWSHANNLGTGDPAGTADVFVYNRTTHAVELDSVGTGGTPAASGDDSFLPSLSGDGRYVVFETKSPFDAPHDTNSAFDIYLHDRVGGSTRLISHTAAGSAGNARSYEGNGGPGDQPGRLHRRIRLRRLGSRLGRHEQPHRRFRVAPRDRHARARQRHHGGRRGCGRQLAARDQLGRDVRCVQERVVAACVGHEHRHRHLCPPSRRVSEAHDAREPLRLRPAGERQQVQPRPQR